MSPSTADERKVFVSYKGARGVVTKYAGYVQGADDALDGRSPIAVFFPRSQRTGEILWIRCDGSGRGEHDTWHWACAVTPDDENAVGDADTSYRRSVTTAAVKAADYYERRAVELRALRLRERGGYDPHRAPSAARAVTPLLDRTPELAAVLPLPLSTRCFTVMPGWAVAQQRSAARGGLNFIDDEAVGESENVVGGATKAQRRWVNQDAVQMGSLGGEPHPDDVLPPDVAALRQLRALALRNIVTFTPREEHNPINFYEQCCRIAQNIAICTLSLSHIDPIPTINTVAGAGTAGGTASL